MRAALLLALLPPPALAERPLTGAEVEAPVEGRTLTDGEAGQRPHGVERHRPGRGATWAWTADHECSPGTWHEERRPGGSALHEGLDDPGRLACGGAGA